MLPLAIVLLLGLLLPLGLVLPHGLVLLLVGILAACREAAGLAHLLQTSKAALGGLAFKLLASLLPSKPIRIGSLLVGALLVLVLGLDPRSESKLLSSAENLFGLDDGQLLVQSKVQRN